jgi:hypothetical protein
MPSPLARSFSRSRPWFSRSASGGRSGYRVSSLQRANGPASIHHAAQVVSPPRRRRPLAHVPQWRNWNRPKRAGSALVARQRWQGVAHWADPRARGSFPRLATRAQGSHAVVRGRGGYVIYEDVRGVEWQSRFRYEHTATKSGLGSSTGVRHLSSATPRPHFPARAGRTRTSPTWLSPCATGLDAGSTRRRSATRRRQAASVPRSQTLEFDPGSGLGGGRDRPHDPRRPPQHGDHANVPTPSRDGLPR